MMVTYESICKKLGFDPFDGSYEVEYHGHEDDSIPNPFSALSQEESDFLFDLFIKKQQKATITIESIIQKLGFDPLTCEPECHEFLVDDSIPSPFAALTYEEQDVVLAYLKENKDKR